MASFAQRVEALETQFAAEWQQLQNPSPDDRCKLVEDHQQRLGALLAEITREGPKGELWADAYWERVVGQQLTSGGIGVPVDREAIGRELDRLKLRGEVLDTTQTVMQQADSPQPPAVYCTNWREILVAVGMKDNREDRQKISRLNKTTGGPITIPGRGKQPFAERVKLLTWWEGLEATFQTAKNRQRDTAATVAEHYHYAREGEVVPDIGGGVKKRRRNRKP